MNYTGDSQTLTVASTSTVSGSRNTVKLSNSDIVLTVMGGSNSIVNGAGSDVVNATGDGNNITGGDGATSITTSGASDQITVGTGTSTVAATGNSTTVTAPSGANLTLSISGDNALVNTQASGTIQVNGSSAIVQLGSGKVTIGIVGTSAYKSDVFGTGGDTFVVPAGSETLPASTFHNYTPGSDHLAILVNSSRYANISNVGLRAQSFVDASQFEVGTSATKTTTRFVYNPTTGHLIFTPYGAVPISSDVAQLPTNLALKASDIFISNASDTSGGTQAIVSGAAVPAYAAPSAPVAPIPVFNVTDETTSTVTTTEGEVYQGPATYLSYSFIKTGLDALDSATSNGVRVPDKIDITTTTPNVFIAASGGEAVGVTSGHNVLSGGAGSNFLVGSTSGPGNIDTFFTDARTNGVVTWNTIVNFHQGDTATLWGFVQGTSTFAWTDNEGAPGYQGVTLYASLKGAADPTTSFDAKVTLAGLTRADLVNTPLSYGNAGGNNPYLAINYP